jgi:hypothetical protein
MPERDEILTSGINALFWKSSHFQKQNSLAFLHHGFLRAVAGQRRK